MPEKVFLVVFNATLKFLGHYPFDMRQTVDKVMVGAGDTFDFAIAYFCIQLTPFSFVSDDFETRFDLMVDQLLNVK